MKQLIFWSFAILVSASSCRQVFGKKIRGNGNITTQQRTVGDFKAIEANGAVNVFYTQDSTQSIKIVGDENLASYIETEIEGDALVIREKNNVNLRPTQEIKVYVSSPFISRIDVSGASSVTTTNRITAPVMDFEVSGAGSIVAEVNSPRINTEVSGAGSVQIKGESKDHKAEISGSGEVNAYELMTESTTVDISGAGDAKVFASISLEADVSGAGSVNYKGKPSVNSKISGAGSVNAVQ